MNRFLYSRYLPAAPNLGRQTQTKVHHVQLHLHGCVIRQRGDPCRIQRVD